MEYIKFMRKPSIDMLPGIIVTRDTDITYSNDTVKQTIKDLVLHSITKVDGEGYTSTYDTAIQLKEGQVVIFEDEARGYIVPVEEFMTVEEIIEDLKCID